MQEKEEKGRKKQAKEQKENLYQEPDKNHIFWGKDQTHRHLRKTSSRNIPNTIKKIQGYAKNQGYIGDKCKLLCIIL